jgi:hypothetical protein
MLRPLGKEDLAMINASDVSTRRALDQTPIALSPMFDPFIKLLTDLGAPTFGSFAVRKLACDADPRLRLLALPFKSEGEAVRFMARFLAAAHDRPDVEEVLDRVGPATTIVVNGATLLFWFGVLGVDALLN